MSETADRLKRYKHRLDMCHDLEPGEAAWLIAKVEQMHAALQKIAEDEGVELETMDSLRYAWAYIESMLSIAREALSAKKPNR